MKPIAIRTALMILGMTLSGQAFSQSTSLNPKPPAARFSLQLPLLKYTNSSIKSDAGNESASELTTQVLDEAFMGVTLGKLALYIFPFDDGNHFVSAGYMFSDDIELGIDLGLNQSNSSDSTLFGAWGVYYSTLGTWGMENGASLNLSNRSDKSPTGPTVKSDEFSLKASSTFTYPLARNLRYIGGAFLRNKSLETDGAKTSVFQFGLILAGIRLKWI